MRSLIVVLALLAATGTADAGRKKTKKTGSIKGMVTTTIGSRPASPETANDEFCAGQERPPRLVVAANHGVVGAYVRIKDASFEPAPTPPEPPVVITQSKCEYAPRMVGVVTGQRLEIHNDDPTFHNVRIVGTDKKVLANKAQMKGAAPITTDAIESDGVVELHCDVHPWMESYAIVADHTHYVFTDAKGRFELAGLPPGTYVVESWHPELGWLSKTVKLKKGKKSAKATLHYDLDDCGDCHHS
jgi:plastocyanin